MSLAFIALGNERAQARQSILAIMVSVWWLLWAFVIGGYSGMLLISLILIARQNEGIELGRNGRIAIRSARGTRRWRLGDCIRVVIHGAADSVD